MRFFPSFEVGRESMYEMLLPSGILLPKAKFSRILDLTALRTISKGAQITTGSSLAY